ncbi:hypothetical protein AB0O01_35830 [Streptomyces sp. NPDC093252]|uniref:hypothetical protein n=1 Tax=Streptomyces sp. NPDC093252 TaxID=3154980 RepID=UPI00342010FB
MLINVATCNFEYNGGGNQTLWRRMHDRLASLGLHLLLRQEMWDAQDNDNELADAAEAVLGMTGRIGREFRVLARRPEAEHCAPRRHRPTDCRPVSSTWKATDPLRLRGHP